MIETKGHWPIQGCRPKLGIRKKKERKNKQSKTKISKSDNEKKTQKNENENFSNVSTRARPETTSQVGEII